MEPREIPLKLKYRVGFKSRQKSNSNRSGNKKNKVKIKGQPPPRKIHMVMKNAHRGKLTKMSESQYAEYMAQNGGQ